MNLKLVKTENDSNIDIDPIFKGLNPEQHKGVKTIEGPVLIVAGAGSGKTKVLTQRIAFLIANGVPGYNILALTFTNKAAKEMSHRISKIVNESQASRIWAGTFHSIFARILRREAEHIGYTNSFSIYDQDDSLSLLKKTIENRGLDGQSSQTPNQIRSKISWAKNKMITPQQLAKEAKDTKDNFIANVYAYYEEELRKNNAMDFDDLLLNTITLLKNNPDVLEKYQDIFKYILVDEYQDTNKAQYLATKMLANKLENICVVGDDAQSIYKWRGADIKNILDFQKDYPTATIIRLEQNYRSTKLIINAADSVIKNNRHQIPKTLWTDNPEGDKIIVYNSIDEKTEAEYTIKEIKKIMEENRFSPKDFAILYRTNAQSLAYENACRRVNLPYLIVGGISFYRRKEVKDVLGYLRLLINPDDSEALLRVVNEPPRGLGATSLKHIKNFADFKHQSMFESFKEVDVIDELQSRAKNSIKGFINLVIKFQELKETMDLLELVKSYIQETGLIDMYRELDTDDSRDRISNIDQVINDLSDFATNNPESGLDEYLQQITLITDLDEKDTSQNQVKLMTLHTAKGLEFPVVFIAGLEEGLFPLGGSPNFPEDTEEERRLFYVGITRAMEKLYFTYADKRMKFGQTQYQKPSKFLQNVDKKYLSFTEHLNSPIKPNAPTYGSSSYGNSNYIKQQNQTKTGRTPNFRRPDFDDMQFKDDYSQVSKAVAVFRTGDRVTHKAFGVGRIELITGEGKNRQAMVNFNSVGRKKLMLEFAKLEKI
jgi:DNA helicase-2/ATP-dependent DNA helicase PcrA